jgi:hypothetical protein
VESHRHYWVMVKLLVTVPCSAILLLHMVPTTRLAGAADQGVLAGQALQDLRVQLVADSIAALAADPDGGAGCLQAPRLDQSWRHRRRQTGPNRFAAHTTGMAHLDATFCICGCRGIPGSALDGERPRRPRVGKEAAVLPNCPPARDCKVCVHTRRVDLLCIKRSSPRLCILSSVPVSWDRPP